MTWLLPQNSSLLQAAQEALQQLTTEREEGEALPEIQVGSSRDLTVWNRLSLVCRDFSQFFLVRSMSDGADSCVPPCLWHLDL